MRRKIPNEHVPAIDDGEGRSSREQGFVLLVVLWVLTSAVILVSTFSGAVRGSTASAISEVGWTKSQALLDAGLEIAAAHLIDIDESRRWSGNGTKHTITFADATLTITAFDTNGMIDLNKTDDEVLRAFFHKFTGSAVQANRLTAAVVQAREDASGDQQNVSAAVAKITNTFSAQPAFADVRQFGRTSGLSTEVFDRMAPYLTVFNGDGSINPLVAPRVVLETIPDLNRADIDRLKYADKSSVDDLIEKAQTYLTDRSGPAFLVTVSAQRPDDGYRLVRKFAIAAGVDPSAPYRLLAKWPVVSTPAEKM
jgi:general secretion pathway protein K